MSTLRNEEYIQSTYHNLIDDECTRKMIVIDIDLFMLKLAKKEIRFIECKHEDEPMSNGQRIAIEELAKLTHPDFKVSAYILTGTPPYELNTLKRIGGLSQVMTKAELIHWFNFGD